MAINMGDEKMTQVSETRQSIWKAMEQYKEKMKLWDRDILDVGIAGDPEYAPGKRGGNHQFFGKNNNYCTLDILPEYEPDFIGDICKTEFPDERWDLVIISQVLEHCWTPKKAIKEAYRIIKPHGWLIVDTPWNYPQHEEDGFGDYWRFTPMGMDKLCEEAGFDIIYNISNSWLVSVLARKNK